MGFVYFVLWHRLTLLSTSERAKFSPLAPTDGCPLASAGSSDPFFREGSWLSGLALLRGALPRGATPGYTPRRGPAWEGCS